MPKLIVSSFVLVFFFLGMTRCSSVDNTLGTDLLPTDAGMDTKFATFQGLDVGKTFITHRDTMNTSNQSFFMLGKMKSDTFGLSKFAHMGQFMPYDKDDEADNFGFGNNPTADSIFIHLRMTYLKGHNENEQTFLVYELNKSLDTENESYTNLIDYENYLGDLLFEFRFKGTPTYDSADSIRLEPTAQGEAFMRKLIADTTLFYDFEKFHETFNGVVIIPADSSPDDAAVYYVSAGSSYLNLWMHNYEDDDPSTIKESLSWGFHFSGTQTYDSPNQSVAIIRHDYSGTPIAPYIADTTLVSDAMFVHSPVGVTGKLEFNEELYDKLDQEVTAGGYSGVFINQVILRINLQDRDLSFINFAPHRLGSYTNFNTFTGIPDYDYVTESASSSITLAYDGYLWRSAGFYNLNITAYFQQALIDREQRLPITFGPDYFYTLSTLAGVALDGCGGNNPIELSIIYTLVK